MAKDNNREPAAFGVFLTDGRFMDIASDNLDDAVEMGAIRYEKGEFEVRPLYASPFSNIAYSQAKSLPGAIEGLKIALDAHDEEVRYQASIEGEAAEFWDDLEVKVEDVRVVLAALRAQVSPSEFESADPLPKEITGEMVKAMRPFAEIAPFVQTTHKRDGEKVHDQRTPDGKWVSLYRADFRKIASAYTALMASLPSGELKSSGLEMTESQTKALDMMGAIGSMYPCKAAGHTNVFKSLVRRGLATRAGKSGPFSITASGTAALNAMGQRSKA